mgnify:FL=1
MRELNPTPKTKPTNKLELLSQTEGILIGTLRDKQITPKELARIWDISHRTVESHLLNIYKKLKVNSLVEAINAVTLKPGDQVFTNRGTNKQTPATIAETQTCYKVVFDDGSHNWITLTQLTPMDANLQATYPKQENLETL